MALITCGSAPAEVPPRRIALVIGNGQYDSLPPLPNAKSDAMKVSQRLTALGFDVTSARDLDQDQLRGTVHTFGTKLKQAGPNVVSFVFYSGHGAQDPARVNYLLPVDATARNGDELRQQATPVQTLLDDMDSADNDVNILVLDACRDWFDGEQATDLPRGLHDMGRHGSVMIAFATSPDTTANDGSGAGSPYTARLVQALASHASEPLSLMFDDIDYEVGFDTDRLQVPEFMDGLARVHRWSLAGEPGPLVSELSPATTGSPVSDYLKGLDKNSLLDFTNGNVSLTQALLSRRDLLASGGINTRQRFVYFIATISYETNNFKNMQEDLDYSASRLMTVFPLRFATVEEAAAYAHSPERIANLVYSNRMGNGDEASGDGWRYRGRGLLGIAGRGNYARLGKAIGVDLLSYPDLMSDPEVGLAAAVSFWSTSKLNAFADNDDIVGLTRRENGGLAGVEPRKKVVLRAFSIFKS